MTGAPIREHRHDEERRTGRCAQLAAARRIGGDGDVPAGAGEAGPGRGGRGVAAAPRRAPRRGQHAAAAGTHHEGGKPDQGSGAWGAWAKTVEGAAKIFGNAAAVKALKEGEEHGVKSYEDALNNPDLPAECQTLIRGTLLPQTRSHLPVLDRLMSAK